MGNKMSMKRFILQAEEDSRTSYRIIDVMNETGLTADTVRSALNKLYHDGIYGRKWMKGYGGFGNKHACYHYTVKTYQTLEQNLWFVDLYYEVFSNMEADQQRVLINDHDTVGWLRHEIEIAIKKASNPYFAKLKEKYLVLAQRLDDVREKMIATMGNH